MPHMIAIMVAKWVADALEGEGVYDLAQTVLGHPFLDLDHSMSIVQKANELVEVLIPPKQTMKEITVEVPKDGLVLRTVLDEKLEQLKRRGLLDAGLVLVQNGLLQGYLAEGELDFGLNTLAAAWDATPRVRLLGNADEGEFDMSMFVDRTPLTICAKAPMEYAVEMFGKLGLRYLCVVEEGSGRLLGVGQFSCFPSPEQSRLRSFHAGHHQEAPCGLAGKLEALKLVSDGLRLSVRVRRHANERMAAYHNMTRFT